MGFDTKFVDGDRDQYSHYTCGVCQQLADLDCLVTTNCSHVICRKCLAQHLNSSTSCPTCKVDLHQQNGQGVVNFVQPLQKRQPLASQNLQNIRVCCPKDGVAGATCLWKGRYADLQQHLLSSRAHNRRVQPTPTTATPASPTAAVNTAVTPQNQWCKPAAASTHAAPQSPRVRGKKRVVKKAVPHKAKVEQSKSLDEDTETTVECSEDSSSESSGDDVLRETKPRAPTSPRPRGRPARTRTGSLASSSHSLASSSGSHIQLICESFRKEGMTHFTLNRYGEAMAVYTRGLDYLGMRGRSSAMGEEANNWKVIFLSNRAACHMAQRNYAEAIFDSKAALAADPKFEKASLRLARAHLHQGNFAAAVRTCQEAVVRRPTAVSQSLRDLLTHCKTMNQAHLNALTYLEGGQYTKTKEQLAVLFKADYSSSSILLLEARADMNLGNLSEAAAHCERVLKDDKQSTKAHLLLGQISILSGRRQYGVSHIKRALKLDPDSSAVGQVGKKWVEVAQLVNEIQNAAVNENWADCLSHADNAIRTCPVLPLPSPLFAILYTAVAEANVGLGDYVSALQVCQVVLSKEPHAQCAEAWLARLSALEKLGRHADARKFRGIIHSTWGKEDARFEPKEPTSMTPAKPQDDRRDFYQVLGVPRDADLAQLRRAFRLKSRDCHPDRMVTASEEQKQAAAQEFEKLNEAMEFLKDDDMRKMYDEGFEVRYIRQRVFKDRAARARE